MKPVSLEFCGINSFSERAFVDFRSLLEYGVFGIFGDTGSGKSTILDCIGFALYGAVSRVRTGVGGDIIHYQADKAYTNFEFEITYEGSRRHIRVEREIKRKNAAQTLKVYEYREGTFQVLADTVREGNALLEKIVGLEQRDFERCIALPQGEFAQFVKATRGERLKLIARLFDLEEYGERLVKKANARYAALEEKRKELHTRLEQYDGVSEERQREYRESIAKLESQEREETEKLALLRKEEKEIDDRLARRREWEKSMKRLEELTAQRADMEELESELGRLGRIADVTVAAQAEKNASAALRAAELAFQRAEKDRAEAQSRARAYESFDENGADEEIARLTALNVRLEQAEKNGRRRAELAKSLKLCREQYAEEAANFKGFSYAEERETLETELAALGNGNFFDYAEQFGKTALLRTEYVAFAEELNTLRAKYPVIEGDVSPLIEKYTAWSAGDKTDFTQLKQSFDARETKRTALQKALRDLETKNGSYRAHCERLQRLQTEGVRFKEELSALGEEERAEMSLAECTRTLERRKREKRERQSAREKAFGLLSASVAAYAAAEARQSAARTVWEQAKDGLQNALRAAGLERVEEAVALTKKYGSGEDAAKRIEDYKAEYASVRSRCEELGKETFAGDEEVRLAQTRQKIVCQEETFRSVTNGLAIRRDELRRGDEALAKKNLLEREERSITKQTEVAERLKKLLDGNKFMDFVAEEYLQNVALNASGRLLTLTDGRYFLRYEGGAVGFVVGDNFNGGNTRGVYTMSGGETFLVSLSLALSLSSEICARSLRPIEFFFLDEGFGTLDEKLVDVVMDSLERLKSENFSIGIISHVEELKHRIVKKLLVKKATEEHGSQIIS